MEILFVTIHNHEDITWWSGIEYYLAKTLESLGHNLSYIEDLKISKTDIALLKTKKLITKKSNLIEREPRILKKYTKQINKRKKNIEYDVIFSPTSLLFAYLKDKKPMVFYTDANFGAMVQYYNWNHISNQSIRFGNMHERMSLNNCAAAIYSSEWARKTAIEEYKVNPQKCHMIHLAANFKNPPTKDDIYQLIQQRNRDIHEILFVGGDWERKGGKIALDTIILLNEQGIKCKLIIIGCDPFIPENYRKYTSVLGFLNKSNPEDEMLLKKSYEGADLFFLPTRAEAFGIVFAEAAAYGLPSIATNTGGVSSAVCDGGSGILLSESAGSSEYAKTIRELLDNKNQYQDMSIKALEFYEEMLTWNSVGKRIEKVLYDVCKEIINVEKQY